MATENCEFEAASFYSCDQDEEHLTATDPDEAIEAFLDDLEPIAWPKSVTVYGFAPMEPPESFLERCASLAVDELLERFDEDFGDPDGEGTGATDEMKAAAREFVEAVARNYQVWTCRKVGEQTFDTRLWR